ncbi:complement C1q-like protein 2 [Ostrea edulis]|uniref:complement C1q-like protein 2 n=1 Tax=Ostrea edulis TaxID=37623 RepID=UPI00209633CE|nr:complement C1q-like protein 2 [Ostrea edulis]
MCILHRDPDSLKSTMKTMNMIILMMCVVCFLFFDDVRGGVSDTRSRIHTLQSLIYNNAKTTVKLDSAALKQLINLSGTYANPPPRVSFSVYVKSKILKLGASQTVVYDGIMTNEGNGYNVRMGVFVCPVTGTYMFIADSLSTKSNLLRIVINKQTVGALQVSSVHANHPWLQNSRTVIVNAKKGDHVKVVNVGNEGTIYNNHYSGFSGTLLY